MLGPRVSPDNHIAVVFQELIAVRKFLWNQPLESTPSGSLKYRSVIEI